MCTCELSSLISSAPEDFGADFEKISSLFQDLTDLRWNKLMKQVADFNQEVDMIKVRHDGDGDDVMTVGQCLVHGVE